MLDKQKNERLGAKATYDQASTRVKLNAHTVCGTYNLRIHFFSLFSLSKVNIVTALYNKFHLCDSTRSERPRFEFWQLCWELYYRYRVQDTDTRLPWMAESEDYHSRPTAAEVYSAKNFTYAVSKWMLMHKDTLCSVSMTNSCIARKSKPSDIPVISVY
jgi:hypothetical protein